MDMVQCYQYIHSYFSCTNLTLLNNILLFILCVHYAPDISVLDSDILGRYIVGVVGDYNIIVIKNQQLIKLLFLTQAELRIL